MVIETTYENKEIRKKINDFIGPSFSLVESIKLNGIGSKRMLVKEFSPNMHQYAQSNQDRQFINVELRPNGIIVHIRKNYSHLQNGDFEYTRPRQVYQNQRRFPTQH
jgi:hypothetical protein